MAQFYAYIYLLHDVYALDSTIEPRRQAHSELTYDKLKLRPNNTGTKHQINI
ncbi:hypothetical protein [Hoylesella loescheii]|uniref:hypothetical protein n=1 Tax=Hoylesella loescheii TaxID=840 RepID=UPI0026EA3EA9|nr:hypothetical protein [Hoylesella loescheii]